MAVCDRVVFRWLLPGVLVAGVAVSVLCAPAWGQSLGDRWPYPTAAEARATPAAPSAERSRPTEAQPAPVFPLWVDGGGGLVFDFFNNPTGFDLNRPFGVSLALAGAVGWRLLPREFTTPFVAAGLALMYTTVFYDDPNTGTTKQADTLGSKLNLYVGLEFLGFNAFVDIGFRSHWSHLRTDGGIDILRGDQAHDSLGFGLGYGDFGSDYRLVFSWPINHSATALTVEIQLHYGF